MNRVAVQLGAARLRVAIADPRPRLLAELPVPEAGPSGPDLAGYTALLDRPADELLVVHGLGAPPVVPATTAAVVRFVPAAVAALASVDAAATGDADRPVPDAVVVDCGHRGTDVVHLVGGRIVAARRVPVGGAVLDAVTAELIGLIGTEQGVRGSVGPAEAHAARETLSLLPVVRVGHPPVELDALALRDALTPSLAEIVDAVRALADGAGPVPPPVLLVGGVARAPLLAELLDAAGVPDVRVIPHPDSAAVVGALRLPAREHRPTPGRPRRPHPPAARPRRSGFHLWLGPGTVCSGRWPSGPRRRSPSQDCTWRVPRCRRPTPPRPPTVAISSSTATPCGCRQGGPTRVDCRNGGAAC